MGSKFWKIKGIKEQQGQVVRDETYFFFLFWSVSLLSDNLLTIDTDYDVLSLADCLDFLGVTSSSEDLQNLWPNIIFSISY